MKIRPGNILGSLTGKNGIEGKQVGKINVFDNCTYVAVHKEVLHEAVKILSNEKWQGKPFRVREYRR